jgi:hypothetical protein
MGCASATNARHAVGVAERIAAPHVDEFKSARVLACLAIAAGIRHLVGHARCCPSSPFLLRSRRHF